MRLHHVAVPVLALAVLLGIGYLITGGGTEEADENGREERQSLSFGSIERDSTDNEPITLQDFKNLHSMSPAAYVKSLNRIERQWQPEYLNLVLEVHRMTNDPARAAEMLGLIQRATGERISRRNMADWRPYYWSLDVEPPDYYPEFKIWLFEQTDENFADYFDDGATGEIPMDEIVWGGVKQDGIPPLKNPEMVPADEALYMGDDNEVFGIVINGDARCYPKRILAHHEMFKDTLGGVSICGVY